MLVHDVEAGILQETDYHLSMATITLQGDTGSDALSARDEDGTGKDPR